ncbi:unnamed protein product [Orchesella dallaii]|uniref:G protein-coupled receptor n=1 Tax=Orchesella dallaii TaxID=48710 RepID=A0ABP1PJV4_9HEXA
MNLVTQMTALPQAHVAGSAFVHVSGVIMVIGNQSSSHEFCRLYSCIRSFGIRDFREWKIKSARGIAKNSSSTVIALLTVFMSVFVAPIYSLVTFVLPCHQVSSEFFKYVLGPSTCNDRRYQLLSYIIELALIVPPTLVVPMEDMLFMEALRTVNYYVSVLKKCQLLSHQINLVTQMTSLPQAHIAGSGIIIAGLYTITNSQGTVPLILYVMSIIFTFEVIVFIFVLLDAASSGLICSKSFIRTVKAWPISRNGLFRRYIRSLAPLRIYAGPFHVVDKKRWKSTSSTGVVQSSSGVVITLVICFICVVMLPILSLVTFVLPCPQVSSKFFKFFLGPSTCNGRKYQLLSYVIELGLLTPPALVLAFQNILFMGALETIHLHVSALITLSKSPNTRSPERRWNILFFYRQCQLFSRQMNLVTQMTTLPQAHVAVLLSLQTIFFIFVLLNAASSGFIVSKSFLRAVKKWPISKNGLFRRYIRSLPPLRIYAGPFHVVDKKRAPLLLRFCLQRTTFLIVQARGSV